MKKINFKSWLHKTVMAVFAVVVMVSFMDLTSIEANAAKKWTLNPTTKTLNVGQTFKIKSNKSVKWSVVKGKKTIKLYSKTKKTVKVKAVKSGNALVRVKIGKKYKNVKIKILPKLSVSSANVQVEKGQYETLTANNDVKWSVQSGSQYIKLSNSAKRSVRVNGLEAGVAYVRAKNTKTGSYKTVKVTVSARTVSGEKFNKVLSGEDTTTKLIDARNSDAYAGWALDEATRGGHFEGAMNLDAAWIGESKLDGIISDNGISANGTYIVYDTNGKDAVAMAKYLKSKGIANVSTYNAVNEINGNAKLVSYENYDLTVPASIVKNISDNVVSGTALSDVAKEVVGDSKNIVILECSWGAPEDTNYVKNHVPGALHIDTNETDPPGVYIEAENEQYLYDYKYEWRLNSDENLIKLFSSRGVTKDSCVVVTGSGSAPVSRCGVLLKYIGVENVHIMSKNYTDWKVKGYAFESENRNAELPNGPKAIAALSAQEAAEKFGASVALHPEVYEKTATVLDRLGDNDYQLVDNRNQKEWDGLTPNYEYEDLAGRIDGSIHSQQNSYNPDNSMRSKLLHDAKWTGDGIDLSKHMTFFCGDGWRAAVDTWNAWVLGYDASIYHGWMEWSNSGCDFINKDGQTVHYDKDQQAVVDSAGTIVQKLTTKLEFEKDEVTVNATGTYEGLNTLINKTEIDPIYSSSDESLVTVAANGTIEVVSMPEKETEVIITALVKDFDNNSMGAKDRSITYKLKLVAGNAEEQ